MRLSSSSIAILGLISRSSLHIATLGLLDSGVAYDIVIVGQASFTENQIKLVSKKDIHVSSIDNRLLISTK